MVLHVTRVIPNVISVFLTFSMIIFSLQAWTKADYRSTVLVFQQQCGVVGEVKGSGVDFE